MQSIKLFFIALCFTQLCNSYEPYNPIVKYDSLGFTPLQKQFLYKTNYHQWVMLLLFRNAPDVLWQPTQYTRATLLHLAAINNNIAAMIFLLKLNPPLEILNAQDRSGNTALHYAVIFGHQGIVELLVGSGAFRSRQNKNGQTVIAVALREALHTRSLNACTILRECLRPYDRDAFDMIDKHTHNPAPDHNPHLTLPVTRYLPIIQATSLR